MTTKYEFRNIRPEEADQAIQIEQICFPPNEACSAKSMKERVANAPETFLVAVDKETGKIAGFLNGVATNEDVFRDEFFTDITLHDPNGKNIILLGLDVLPEYRHQGLAREIMSRYVAREQENQMIRLQDIADMAGVSRTTVSNVINGNTKRVSQETIDKITAILKEQNYVPHMGSVMLSGHGSRIIGVVLGFAQTHGMYSLQDSFVGELVGTIQMEAEMKGYYVMLIGGENIQNVVDIASRWNVEGLIILGYNDEKYRKLSRKLNKKMVLIDAYPAGEYFFQNVGVDDYSGGYQIGSYLCSCGFDKALFLAETDIDSDYSRWMGFKQAMEKEGKFCSRTRLIVIPGERNRRIQKYKELLPRFLQVKAVAFSSDYAAIEAMNFLSDHGIKVPEQVSVTGFDDSIYARMVRPRLTTVHQDVGQKAHLAFSRLLRMVAGEQLKEFNIKSPVYLVKRDSVKT